MTRRIFVDTEWTAPPWSPDCELMWVGLADDGGRSWSAISADVELDPEVNDFIAGVWKLISPEDPRSTAAEMSAGVVAFCGEVDEFWAWVPTEESIADWFGLGPEASDLHARYWDWDLQVLRALVDPWPSGWPDRLHDLTAASLAAGVELPPRRVDHLAPEVHARWNRELHERIRKATEVDSDDPVDRQRPGEARPPTELR